VTKPAAKAPAKPAPKKAVKPAAKVPAKPAAKAAVVKAPAKKPQTAAAKPAATVNKTAKPAANQPATKSAPATALKPPVKSPNASGLPKATAKNVRDIKVVPPKPVAIPKLTTKSSRKYQPDFTKSVLDQPKADPGAPIVRYSDSELTEFRDLIQRKLEAAKKELNYRQGLITRKDEMGGDESENRYLTMEDGSLSMEREQLSQMASRQITYIDHLEKALMRIENKTYGICRVTGKLIDKARLRAVPHATLSIEAKMGIVK
jgi:RNA polymerase-binding transcription factor DksA